MFCVLLSVLLSPTHINRKQIIISGSTFHKTVQTRTNNISDRERSGCEKFQPNSQVDGNQICRIHLEASTTLDRVVSNLFIKRRNITVMRAYKQTVMCASSAGRQQLHISSLYRFFRHEQPQQLNASPTPHCQTSHSGAARPNGSHDAHSLVCT